MTEGSMHTAIKPFLPRLLFILRPPLKNPAGYPFMPDSGSAFYALLR